MTFHLILDENVDHEVATRLRAAGHDVVHVEDIPALGKSADDRTLAAYSRSNDRIIVTHDDDFVRSIDNDAFTAVLFVGDASVSAKRIANRIDRIADYLPHRELDGVQYVGADWDCAGLQPRNLPGESSFLAPAAGGGAHER